MNIMVLAFNKEGSDRLGQVRGAHMQYVCTTDGRTYEGHHRRVFRRRPVEDAAFRQPRVRVRALSTHYCHHAYKNYCGIRAHFVVNPRRRCSGCVVRGVKADTYSKTK